MTRPTVIATPPPEKVDPIARALTLAGICAGLAVPVKLEMAGWEQLALPPAVIPVAKLFAPHCVGVDARAVAVDALPVVFAPMVAARFTVVLLLTAESVSANCDEKFRFVR